MSNQSESEKQEPVGKLKVTLEDRPIDIELAQYKRMFEAACSALGEVSEALGCDPNEGGSEPLIAAIERLKSSSQEPIAWMVYTLDGKSAFVTDNPTDFTDEHRALPLYTHLQPKEWVGLTPEQRNDCLVEADPCECLATPEAETLMEIVEAKLKALNT